MTSRGLYGREAKLDSVIQLPTVHPNALGRLDADFNVSPLDAENPDGDPVADSYRLFLASNEN